MRLIDADVLIDKVDKYIYRITRASKLKVGESAIIADIKAHIELSPTIDAEPVRHGKWIKHEYAEESEGLLIPNYECSECHMWERKESDYCPNCGARMDKE